MHKLKRKMVEKLYRRKQGSCYAIPLHTNGCSTLASEQ